MNIQKKSKAYKHRESRFNALFPKRVEKSIATIQSIKKLSNKTNYVYNSKQIYEGLTLIINELNSVFTSFGLDDIRMSLSKIYIQRSIILKES